MQDTDADKFWTLVDRVSKATKGGTLDYDESVAFWAKETEADLKLFCQGVQQRFVELNRWDIWAVGAILGGFIGHTFSERFRVWLILQGRDAVERALKDPSSIAKLSSADDPCSPFDTYFFRNATAQAYRRLDATAEKGFLDSDEKDTPKGKAWQWRDLAKLHPDLWQSYFVKRDRRPAEPGNLMTLKDLDLVWLGATPLHEWCDIYRDPAYLEEQYKQLSAGQRALHAVKWYKSEVDNGGIDQFFHNSTGVVAPEALAGLKLFGATVKHDRLKTIMAAFPGGSPNRDNAARRKQMKERWGDKNIDDVFPEPKDASDLVEDMARYMRANPRVFFRAK